MRVLAFLPLAAAARMRRIERRTVERLQAAGADVLAGVAFFFMGQ